MRLAFDEIRQAGAASRQVSRRLTAALEDLLRVAPPDRRAILRRELELLHEQATAAAPTSDNGDAAVEPDPAGIGSAAPLVQPNYASWAPDWGPAGSVQQRSVANTSAWCQSSVSRSGPVGNANERLRIRRRRAHLTKSAAATSTRQTRSATKGVNTVIHLLVRAIDPAHLDDVRTSGADGQGNRLYSFAAAGQGEPLRCCLRYARKDEQITLISYAPFELPSVWREVGPVYIHAARCDGFMPAGRLPEQLATGPRVLGTYRADDTMNYDHNTVILDEADLEPTIERLLAEPDVATIHVRTVAPQCFLYAVAAS